MCSHRLAVAKLVRDYKEPLFSHSPQISRQNKQELWEFIRQQAIAQGAIQYMRKSWKEIRDCVWAPIRRDTMAKVNKAKLVGEDSVLYTEIDKIVLEIIGTNGTGGLDEAKGGGGGIDFFNDENMASYTDGGQQPPSLDAYNDSGPMSNASGMEHLLGPHSTNGINGSGSTSTTAEGITNHVVDIKPGTSLSQMLEMFRDPSQQNIIVGQNQSAVDVWQQMDEIVAEQQNEQRMNGAKNVGTPPIMSPSHNNTHLQHQQNALKRKASSQQQQIIPNKYGAASTSSTTFGTAQNYADAELDRAIKQAKLEQIQLENQLIQEQIEEKHLQNQLLKIEIAERKATMSVAKK